MVTHLQAVGEGTELGMHVCASSAMYISISVRGCHQIGWEEAKSRSHVEKN